MRDVQHQKKNYLIILNMVKGQLKEHRYDDFSYLCEHFPQIILYYTAIIFLMNGKKSSYTFSCLVYQITACKNTGKNTPSGDFTMPSN